MCCTMRDTHKFSTLHNDFNHVLQSDQSTKRCCGADARSQADCSRLQLGWPEQAGGKFVLGNLDCARENYMHAWNLPIPYSTL
jgi:hypothetical protein